MNKWQRRLEINTKGLVFEDYTTPVRLSRRESTSNRTTTRNTLHFQHKTQCFQNERQQSNISGTPIAISNPTLPQQQPNTLHFQHKAQCFHNERQPCFSHAFLSSRSPTHYWQLRYFFISNIVNPNTLFQDQQQTHGHDTTKKIINDPRERPTL